MTERTRQTHMSARVNERRQGTDRAIFPHAVSYEGGRTIQLSGQLAFDPDGHVVGIGDMRAQYVQVAENIKAVLEDAGGSLADVVKMTTFVTDIDAHLKCLDLRLRYFAEAWPTSTTVEVRKLAHPDMVIEIEVTAVV